MSLHTDIETYSEEELKDAGVYRYAEHASTEINCLGWAVDDGPVHLWIPFDDVPATITETVQMRHPTAVLFTGTKMPAELEAVWDKPKRAHNAQFERVVINGRAGEKLTIPRTQISEWTCTAVKAAESGIPRSLDEGSKALGTHKKSDAGRIEMLQLSKPKKPSKVDPTTRYLPSTHPEKWIAMLCYNIEDVMAERDLDNALPDNTTTITAT